MLQKKVHQVVGSGFLASKFKKYLKTIDSYNLVIYAAGISNSLERKNKELNKEIIKIKQFLKKNKKKILYISTYSINDNSRKSKPYVKNKIKIEKLIKSKSNKYLIIRLPEIIGKNKNSNTLTNFFFKKIINNESFSLYKNTKRNLLDVDDAVKNCIKLFKVLDNNQVINLLNKRFYTPIQIVKMFEKILNKKAIYKYKYIKKNYDSLQKNFYIKTNDNYLSKILKRHYRK